MDKRLLNLIAFASLTIAGHSQSTVLFVTRTLGPTARILDWNGIPVGSADASPEFQNGQNVLVQLYAAPGLNNPASALLPVGTPVNVRNNFNAGYVQESGNVMQGVGGAWIGTVNPVVTIPNTIPGGPVTVQVRAWMAAYGVHYVDGWAGGLGWMPMSGASILLNLPSTGDGSANPPVPLVGFTGFWINLDSQGPVFSYVMATNQPSGQIEREGFRLDLWATTEMTWTVEYSSDFLTWRSLSTNFVMQNPLHLVDLDATNAPIRFYRARWQ